MLSWNRTWIQQWRVISRPGLGKNYFRLNPARNLWSPLCLHRPFTPSLQLTASFPLLIQQATVAVVVRLRRRLGRPPVRHSHRLLDLREILARCPACQHPLQRVIICLWSWRWRPCCLRSPQCFLRGATVPLVQTNPKCLLSRKLARSILVTINCCSIQLGATTAKESISPKMDFYAWPPQLHFLIDELVKLKITVSFFLFS